MKEEYLAFQRQYSYDISNLKIAMDCSNGMATILVKDLFGTAPIMASLRGLITKCG